MRKKEEAAKAKAKAAATKAKALAAQKKKAKEEAQAQAQAQAREARSSSRMSSCSVVESEPPEDSNAGDAGVWSRRPTPYMWALSATYTAIMPMPVVHDVMQDLSGPCKVLVDSEEMHTDDCPQAVACCVLGMIR
eukprot:TRINITY_DN1653_c0_g1_i1.p2 TRINITY_DN1653_c0_g1~~TRINITY_DN1653_c0_g1_i1.p2  ORF type:complete len:135 (+),score=35.56 TRINITY_DN1653_c0_g1_i1:255-659(+)